jgi:hypothetical protein
MSTNNRPGRPTTRSHRALKPGTTHRPQFGHRIEELEDRTTPSWFTFAGNPQHTGLSTVPSQPVDVIHWQTPADLNPTGAAVHYGSPVFTPANTVVYPIKTGASDGFAVAARAGATGNLLWTIPTDYTLPPHSWLPPLGPTLTSTGRLYFAGNGGTVYFVDNPDTPGATVGGQLAFFGLSSYLANPGAYNSTVFIDTPITADNNGNVYFGFMVTGANPSGLTGGGIARIDASGNGSFVLASTAVPGGGMTRVPLAAAPALSPDGTTLYTAFNNTSQNGGFLVGLNSTTLATKFSVALKDPRNNNAAQLIDQSTASPLVGPDGTVYFGVFGNPFNGSRGFLLHYSADLSTQFAPGVFGWDDTQSIVPASAVPGYHGTSSYLLFSKYNNYVSAEVGSTGGDGVNKIAILDPYATQPDPNNDNASSLQVMREVLTQIGPTPDTEFTGSGFPNAVREWCINSTAIDPFNKCALVNSEDGNLYRWDFTTNTLTQMVNITPGIGEPYTPTSIGPDGTVYAINGGTLTAIGGFSGYTITAVSSKNPAAVSDAVTFTATLAPTTGGPTPSGSVTFLDGPATLATLPLVDGQATYTTPFATAGSHFITASYSGGGPYAAGTATLVESVRTYTTTAALKSGQLVITDATLGGKDDNLTITADVANGRYVVSDPTSAFAIVGTITGASVSADTHAVFVPFAAVTGSQVAINTLDGNDTLTVDLSGGAFPKPIVYDGGTQTLSTGNGLRVVGTGTQTATYKPDTTAPGKGTVTTSAGSVSFVHSEPVDISGMATATLNLPGGADNLTLADGTDFLSGVNQAIRVGGTSGGLAIEPAAFFNNTALVIDTVTGGSDGNDTITVSSADLAHGNINLTITTGTGSDVVNVNGPISVAQAGSVAISSQQINVNAPISTGVDGTVNLNAGAGSIVDGNAFGADIIARFASLVAGTGVGTAANPLELNLNVVVAPNLGHLTSASTASGGIFVDLLTPADAGVVIDSATATAGDVVFTSTIGGGTNTLFFTSVLATNGNIDLSADVATSIHLNNVRALAAGKNVSVAVRAAANGIDLNAPTTNVVANNGTITFTANSVGPYQGNLSAGPSGTIVLQPFTAGFPVEVGGAAPSGPGILGVGNAALATITNTGTIAIGSATSGSLSVISDVSVASSLTLTTDGSTVNLNGNVSTDTGANAGSLTVGGPVRLGANVVIDTDAAGTDGNVTFNGPVDADAAGNSRTLQVVAGGGNMTFAQNVGAAAHLQTFTTTSAHNVSLQRVSTRTGGVSVAAAGTITLNGDLTTNAMATAGPLTLSGAVGLGADVTLNTDGAATDADITIATGSTVNGARNLTLTAGGGNVVLNNTVFGGSTPLTTLAVSAANVTGSGGIATSSGLSVTNTGTASTLSGVLSGAGGLAKAGAGSLTLSGASGGGFTGTTAVTAGTLVVNGSIPGSPVSLTGATLSGVGTVKSITTSGGTLSPGGAAAVGTLSTAAGASASTFAGATLRVDVNAGAVSDRLVVGNGATVNLAGATLSVNVLGATTGNVYTLVSSGTGGISGTFSGLANGATFVTAGRTFQVGYTANAVTLTVVPSATATAVSSASAPFSIGGQSVSLSATVTSPVGTVNEGTETFTILNGATPVGSPITVNVSGGTANANYALPAGTPAGTYTIQAAYNGTVNFVTSTDTSHTLTVSPVAATTTATSTSATFTVGGQSVNLNATVTSTAGVVGEGTVTFTVLDGGTAVGSQVTVGVSGGSAAASYALPAGTHSGVYTIRAAYNGTSNLGASTEATHTLTINPAATTTTATPAATTFSVGGQSVNLIATVTSPAGVVDVGTMTFTVLSGAAVVGSPLTVSVGGGAATAVYVLPAGTGAGSYALRADYSGTADLNTSTDGTHRLTVNPAPTATATAPASTAFSVGGSSVSLSATVASPAGTVDEGTVTFTVLSGASTVGTPVTVSVTGGAASATYAVPGGTPAGTYTIQATYDGTANLTTSTDGAHQLTVTPAVTTTTATSASATFSPLGQSVSLGATVTSAAGIIIAGTVTFTILNGTTVVGNPVTVNVAAGSAHAPYELPAGTAGGTYTIRAAYSGTPNFAASTEAAHQLTVNPAATTTTAASASAVFSSGGQSVPLTATVTSPAGTVNEGTETFTALNGSTVVGSPVTVNVAAGSASASYALPAGTGAGTYTIRAVYDGTAAFGTSTDAAHTLTVGRAAVSGTAASTSVIESNGPQTVTLTTTLTSPAGTVNGGTVTFSILSGGATVGTPVTAPVVNGTATADDTLPGHTRAGSYTIQAVYSGTADFAGLTDTAQFLRVAPNPVLVGVGPFAVGADAGGGGTVTEYNPDGSTAAAIDIFPGTTGGVRTAVADFNGDGTPDVAVATGPGATAEVKVLDGKTRSALFDVRPFADFTGGVFVAAGDVTGDGKAELVVTPDLSGGPRVEVYRGGDFALVANFFTFTDDPNFRGGARAAAGDLNGDGFAELVISAGFGGGPRIAVYDGKALAGGDQVHLVPDFFLFEPALRNGAYVAVGDVNGDGLADVIGGGGPGGGPRVLVVSGKELLSAGAVAAIATPVANFFAGNVDNRGGIRVAAKNLDGDDHADLVVGDGTGAGSRVTAYLGKALAADSTPVDFAFDAFPGFTGGVFVG